MNRGYNRGGRLESENYEKVSDDNTPKTLP